MTTVATGWWSQHGVHAVTIAGPILVFALVGLGADARVWLRKRELSPRLSLLNIAAGLSIVAASIHVAVCPEHFKEGLIYGLFFAAASTAQFGWSALVLTRSRRPWLAPAGLLGNASLVTLWAVTRTVGIPLGPSAGEIERVGVLDLACQACEVGVMALCVVVLVRRARPADARDHGLGVLAP
jgi:hypothetical protein